LYTQLLGNVLEERIHVGITIEKIHISQKQHLRNLMSLYLHDISEYDSVIELNNELIYEFDVLDLFFKKDGLDPFYILKDLKIIGFILIQSSPFTNIEYTDYVINSMFVIKKYRRQGFGVQAINRLFEILPGRYSVGQLVTNEPAVLFWKAVYSKCGIEFEEREVTEHDMKLVYQNFTVASDKPLVDTLLQ
jgi:predicted acetyltransferase